MLPLLLIAANLSSLTFGQDAYTKMLERLSVGSDWKNIMGQDVYRNMIIYDREFANAFHQVAYPEVPREPDYVFYKNGTRPGGTSYNITSTVEMFICMDKGLSSRCSYMTKISVDDKSFDGRQQIYSTTIRNVYSIVIPNK